MIQYIEIEDTKYPILFSFRAVFGYMNKANISSLEEAEKSISIDFDSLLSLYEQGFEKGARKDEEFDGDPLTAEEIEDAIDAEPALFQKLAELLNESKVMKSFKGEETDKKK